MKFNYDIRKLRRFDGKLTLGYRKLFIIIVISCLVCLWLLSKLFHQQNQNKGKQKKFILCYRKLSIHLILIKMF